MIEPLCFKSTFVSAILTQVEKSWICCVSMKQLTNWSKYIQVLLTNQLRSTPRRHKHSWFTFSLSSHVYLHQKNLVGKIDILNMLNLKNLWQVNTFQTKQGICSMLQFDLMYRTIILYLEVDTEGQQISQTKILCIHTWLPQLQTSIFNSLNNFNEDKGDKV